MLNTNEEENLEKVLLRKSKEGRDILIALYQENRVRFRIQYMCWEGNLKENKQILSDTRRKLDRKWLENDNKSEN